MALRDVLAATRYIGYTPEEQAVLRGVLIQIYNGSATARAAMENWITGAEIVGSRTFVLQEGIGGHRRPLEPGEHREIIFTNVPGAANATLGTGRINYGLDFIENLAFIDTFGNGVAHDHLYVINHELGHAIHGFLDVASLANGRVVEDIVGDTVRYQNIVQAELGLPQRASYYAAGTLPQPGFSYTSGEEVDLAIVLFAPIDTTAMGASRDLIVHANVGHTLSTGAGRDWIHARGGDDTVFAGDGDDNLFGGGGQDRLYGGRGDDYMIGGADNDTLFGGAGSDTMLASEGSDRLHGGDGGDHMSAGSLGTAILYGERGNDIIRGNSQRDQVFGGPGNDVVYGEGGNDFVYDDSGNNWISAGAGNDVVYVRNGNNTLIGGTGADNLISGEGRDRLFGGNGADRLATGGGNDMLIGGDGDDNLRAGAGDDRLWGGSGNDILSGGGGNDMLIGGAGRDQFVFAADGSQWDMVWDFASGIDTLNFINVIGLDGRPVQDGATADTNRDGQISAADNGWENWSSGGLEFTGQDGSIRILLSDRSGTLELFDIV